MHTISKPTQFASLILALLALAPTASADPVPPLPPQAFQATYDQTSDTVSLTWLPPDTQHTYHYALYRGNTFLADVSTLSYTDTQPSSVDRFYFIQAIRPGDGPGESAVEQYSTPVVTFVWIIIECVPIIVVIGGPGIVSPGVRGECL